MSGPSRDTARRRVVSDSLGVGVATGAYGISFGALGTASGLDVLQTCALSLLAFTGASQFAFIGVVAAGGAPITGAVTSVLLGSRNLFYGLSLASFLRVRGLRRLVAAHLVIDESTAMAVAQEDERLARTGFWWTGTSIFVLWNLSTFVGALAGTAIGDPRTYGLDAAVGAAFLGLLWPRLRSPLGRLVALLGAAVALGLIPLTPAGGGGGGGGPADHPRRCGRRRGRDAGGPTLPRPRSRAQLRGADVSATWTGVMLVCAGCYALKLAGLSVPEAVLDHPMTRRAVDLIPAALLGALIAVQVLADGQGLAVDARLAALALAAVLLVLRVPFLPLVAAAALLAALLRLAGWG